jgi:hypothetical protein
MWDLEEPVPKDARPDLYWLEENVMPGVTRHQSSPPFSSSTPAAPRQVAEPLEPSRGIIHVVVPGCSASGSTTGRAMALRQCRVLPGPDEAPSEG